VCASPHCGLRVEISCFPSARGWSFHRDQAPEPSDCGVKDLVRCIGVSRSGRVWVYHYFCDEIHESLLRPLLLARIKHAPDRLVSGFWVGSAYPHPPLYRMMRFAAPFPSLPSPSRCPRPSLEWEWGFGGKFAHLHVVGNEGREAVPHVRRQIRNRIRRPSPRTAHRKKERKMG
jgi:hypothetical protein